MQSSRWVVTVIAVWLLCVSTLVCGGAKAGILLQSGGSAPTAAAGGASSTPAEKEQEASAPAAQQGASTNAAQGGAAATQKDPAKAQAVAPPPENSIGYRDPDWGPRRELKKKNAVPFVTAPYQTGQVFVSDGSGDVDIFQADGTMIGTLATGQSLSAGMSFDRSGNLYVTTFSLPTGVVEFDVNGNLIGPFGTFPTTETGLANPESVLVSATGNIFVGAASAEFDCGTGDIVPAFEFSPAGALLNTFNVLSECRGTDWVELLADQKTLLYTSEGLSIKSFNTATGTQNPDFADNLPGSSAYAFRQLPDGTVLVADSASAERLSATGAILTSYTPSIAVSTLFALNLDPDGTTFWTADLQTGNIFRFDIATGTQVTTFASPTAFASGLAIFGEKTAGNNNLTITVAGTGSGQVTTAPTGINCPAVCVAQFPDNANVVVTATPATGSAASFSANCVAANPQTTPPSCTVPIVASDVTVTVTFSPSSGLALTVTEGGTGTGTVTSAPAGISCPSTCTGNFASGTAVVLTATPTNGSTFAGWGAGPCEGTGTCTVTITQATTVGANFTAGTSTNFTLTVTEAGTGSGNVTSAPLGINCPDGCSGSFASGTQVTLTETPSEGSVFAGWSGACSGTETCVVTVTAATAVTATFNSSNSVVTITIPSGGSTTGTTTPGGTTYFGLIITCAPGQTGTVTLTATSSSPLISVNFIPNTVVCPGGAEQAVQLQTFCQGTTVTQTGSLPGGFGFGGGIGMMLMGLMMGGMALVSRKSRRVGLTFAVLALAALGAGSCGGLPKSPTGQATPPGTYFISLTATLNGQTTTQPNFLTLVVK
jgi:List-Bact-rpt repeat protein